MHVPIVFITRASFKWMVFIDAHHVDSFSGEWCTRAFIVTLKFEVIIFLRDKSTTRLLRREIITS